MGNRPRTLSTHLLVESMAIPFFVYFVSVGQFFWSKMTSPVPPSSVGNPTDAVGIRLPMFVKDEETLLSVQQYIWVFSFFVHMTRP